MTKSIQKKDDKKVEVELDNINKTEEIEEKTEEIIEKPKIPLVNKYTRPPAYINSNFKWKQQNNLNNKQTIRRSTSRWR